MSIYATLWELKFPRGGDYHFSCEWEEVVAQGVPAHIGTPTPGHGYEDGDPYRSFLPPAIPVVEPYDMQAMRAVVIIRSGTEKIGQEYVNPLLVLTGQEYSAITFDALYHRICDALRGSRPKLVAEFLSGDGNSRLIYDDGSSKQGNRREHDI